MQKVLFYLAVGLLVAKALNPGYLNFGQWGVAKNALWATMPKISLPSLPLAVKKTAPSTIPVLSKCDSKADKIYRNLGEGCNQDERAGFR